MRNLIIALTILIGQFVAAECAEAPKRKLKGAKDERIDRMTQASIKYSMTILHWTLKSAYLLATSNRTLPAQLGGSATISQSIVEHTSTKEG